VGYSYSHLLEKSPQQLKSSPYNHTPPFFHQHFHVFFSYFNGQKPLASPYSDGRFALKFTVMPHSFSKIWIHAIWATKERAPFIIPKIELEVYSIMQNQLADLESPAKIINGMPEHVHMLFQLSPKHALMNIIKQVKGSCSEHINRHELIEKRFSWQVGYSAYSVSESSLERVYNYILRQKQHHLKQTFEDEYNEFLRKHGFFPD
jgi:putative transposase